MNCGTPLRAAILAVAALVAGAGPQVLRAADAPSAPDLGPGWTKTSDGLEVAVRPAGSAMAVLVRVDLARFAVRLVPAGGAPLTAPAAMAQLDGAAAINGGFFDEAGRAIGWVVSDGREISPPSRRGWAALALRKDRAEIVPAATADARGVIQAVQAGPRLVTGGRPNARLKAQTARRSFVGVDAAGRLVLGCTGPSAVDAGVLARFLATPEADGGVGLVDALNLDGGGSSQLHVRGVPGGDIALPGVPVANVLVVVPR